MILIPVASSGPDWASIITAWGTIFAVIAAVGIALGTEQSSGRRLKAEHERSDRLLKEERALEQQREQFAEANAVQVLYAVDPSASKDAATLMVTDSGRDSVLVIVNHGKYTITDMDARLVLPDRKTEKFGGWERLSGMEDVDPRLLAGVGDQLHELRDTHRLSPWDLGLRVYRRPLPGTVAVLRWTDRWGTRWEHRRGEVRQVRDDEPWSP